jgi:hypothetical protein
LYPVAQIDIFRIHKKLFIETAGLIQQIFAHKHTGGCGGVKDIDNQLRVRSASSQRSQMGSQGGSMESAGGSYGSGTGQTSGSGTSQTTSPSATKRTNS